MINVRVEDGLPITAHQASSILREHSNKFGIYFDYDRLVEYDIMFEMERKKYSNSIMREYRTDVDDKASVIYRLIDLGVDKKIFSRDGKTKFSQDHEFKKIFSQYSHNADIIRLMNLIVSYKSVSTRQSGLKSYINLPIVDEVSATGSRMVHASPETYVLSTGRISYRNPGVQTIPRDMGDIITSPRGWIIMGVDSSQIEPRITFSYYYKSILIKKLMMHFGDAYKALVVFCLLPEEIYRAGDYGSEFNPDDYAHDIADKRQDMKVLVLSANYGAEVAKVDPQLFMRYKERVINLPERIEFENRVRADVSRGADRFYSAFGTPIIPEDTGTYKKSDPESWHNHLVRCGLNNPIQGTASDLMVISVNESNKICRETGDAHIAYYKHDEGKFYVREDAIGTQKLLEDITAYNVSYNGDQWIPIPSDCEYGQKRSKYGSKQDNLSLLGCVI